MKRLPNLISCFRIALSIMLLFLIDKPLFFVGVYFFCGISDVSDGFIARLIGAETALGAKLDSAGDFVFFAVWLFIFLVFINDGNRSLMMTSAIAVAIIRTTNLVITKVKFEQWGIVHTVGNKLTGFVLFLMLPVCIFIGEASDWIIILTGMLAALTALEESVILLKSNIYNANKRSIFLQKRRNTNVT